MSYTEVYLNEVIEVTKRVDVSALDAIVRILVDLRTKQGRLFFLGVGGSAANASHAVNDFEDRRNRSLRAHRQRVGADGANQ